MKKLAIALLALLIPSVAMAGWNIRQNDDGTTVWVNGEGETAAVGSPGLTVTITDLSTAATRMVVSDRAGKIKKVYGVVEDAHTAGEAAPLITVLVQNSTAGQFTPISDGVTLSMATDTPGSNASISPSYGNDIVEGGVIAVHTGGQSSTRASGTITIVIE